MKTKKNEKYLLDIVLEYLKVHANFIPRHVDRQTHHYRVKMGDNNLKLCEEVCRIFNRVDWKLRGNPKEFCLLISFYYYHEE